VLSIELIPRPSRVVMKYAAGKMNRLYIITKMSIEKNPNINVGKVLNKSNTKSAKNKMADKTSVKIPDNISEFFFIYTSKRFF